MTRWGSDTCDCVIVFDDQTLKITDIIRKCSTHDPTIGNNFITCDSRSYNQSVNESVSLSLEPTKIQLSTLSQKKREMYLK